jgi:choline-sulfatase
MTNKIILALILLAVLGLGLYLRYNKQNPKNLILITVDTLRADRLSLYGCPRNTSPELDKRAANAMVFDRALCQWPKTVPSMVSIFSSTYPHTNGILFGSRGQWVEDRILMFPEIMKEHGYKTYGVVSNAVLASETNFSQGFDVYRETWMDSSRGKNHSQADHVTDFALQVLKELPPQNFMLWIHYVDPHYQYKPPAPYDRMYVEDKFYNKKHMLRLNPEDSNYFGGVAGRVYALDQTLEWDYYIAQYDAEIRFVDDQLKRLFAEFDRKKLWDSSIIVLTADHGESLGENRYFFEHGWFPYTASSNVPLIVWDPREKPRRISTSTALLDLVPSLFKALKLPQSTTFEGKPWDFNHPRPVYIESGEGLLNKTNYIRSLWSWPYHLVYVPNETYQRMMQKVPFELYNVENDWQETKNIIAKNPELATKLEKELLHWIHAAPNYVPVNRKTPDYDPQAIEQMESLGYLQ